MIILALSIPLLLNASLEAQQIYRWTDEQGKVHFGNQPPPDAGRLKAVGRQKSRAEIECETTVREKCRQQVEEWGKWWDSHFLRNCIENGEKACRRAVPREVRTEAPQHFVSTPTLPFDPELGDSIECEMRCRAHCRATVEIRTNRVIKKGENYGAESYTVKTTPQRAGSAYCTTTTQGEGVLLTLKVIRNGRIVARVAGQ